MDDHKNLFVWKKSMDFVVKVYEASFVKVVVT